MRKKIFLLYFVISSVFIFAQSSKSEGEKLFLENNPEQAIVLLEQEIIMENVNPKLFNYLGLAYFQVGEFEKSIEVFSKGISTAGTNKKLLSYNQGNSYFALKDFENAIKAYSLSLTADPNYKEALLNRANAYTMNANYDLAVADYEKFLELYNSRNFSQISKSDLLLLIQYVDTTDLKQDGVIGSFGQGQTGDCWLLSSLRSISQNPEYAQILKDSIKNNGDGTYTVNFKGLDRRIENLAQSTFRQNTSIEFSQYLSEKFPDLSEEKQAQMTSYLVELLEDESIEPKDETERLAKEAFVQFKASEAFQKLEQQRVEMINNLKEQFKNGIRVTEEELLQNRSTGPDGQKAGVLAFGDKDVRIFELAMEKFMFATGRTLEGGNSKLGIELLIGKDVERYGIAPLSDKEQAELDRKQENGEISDAQYNDILINKLSENDKVRWTEVLENTDSFRLSASSKIDLENADSRNLPAVKVSDEQLGERIIYKNHVYNISKVDKENKIIYVENPWEPEVQIPVTYEEFFNCFSSLFVLQE